MDLYQTLTDSPNDTDMVYAFRSTGQVDQIIRVPVNDVTGTNISTGNAIPQVQTSTKQDDLFINTITGSLYKFDGVEWSEVGSLIGPQGPTGPQGITSADSIIKTSTIEITLRELVELVLSTADFSTSLLVWLNSLPTSQPQTSGIWWNNSGIPTLS